MHLQITIFVLLSIRIDRLNTLNHRPAIVWGDDMFCISDISNRE